jgi:hypothetical protein
MIIGMALLADVGRGGGEKPLGVIGNIPIAAASNIKSTRINKMLLDAITLQGAPLLTANKLVVQIDQTLHTMLDDPNLSPAALQQLAAQAHGDLHDLAMYLSREPLIRQLIPTAIPAEFNQDK